MSRRADPQFAPVTQIRAHEYVAEQIRRHIKLRLAGPGQALPPERELAKQFGVGRPTIQMALRLLEAEHLIEVRRGRSGGTFIIEAVGSEDGRYELVSQIQRRRREIADLLGFRDAVEPEIARVAAHNRRQPDLRRMRHAVRALDAASVESEYMRHDTELHLALGAATQNRFLAAAAEDMRRGLNDVISLLPESELWQERVAREHHELLEAVERRDPGAAAEVIRTHAATSHQGVLAVLSAISRGR